MSAKYRRCPCACGECWVRQRKRFPPPDMHENSETLMMAVNVIVTCKVICLNSNHEILKGIENAADVKKLRKTHHFLNLFFRHTRRREGTNCVCENSTPLLLGKVLETGQATHTHARTHTHPVTPTSIPWQWNHIFNPRRGFVAQHARVCASGPRA